MPQIVENLLTPTELATFVAHVHSVFKYRKLNILRIRPDGGTDGVISDPEAEKFLRPIQARIEPILGKTLFPTYASYRMYYAGTWLRPHTDTLKCEHSVSLVLDRSSDEAYPLFVDGVPYDCKPCSGILYEGQSTHWRGVCPLDYAVQMFLHYVDANGLYANLKYNRRPGLACD